MKELGKYLVISALFVCTVFLLFADVVTGQVKLEDARYRFDGKKAIYVLDLSDKTLYTVTPDWLGRTIVIDIPNIDTGGLGRYANHTWKNIIVTDADLQKAGNGFRLVLKTKDDFVLNYRLLPDGNRLYCHVSPQIGPPDRDTLLDRAVIYEGRGEPEKAAIVYRSILDENPGDQEVRYALGKTLLAVDPAASHDVFAVIPEDSKYFEKSRGLLEHLRGRDNTEDTANQQTKKNNAIENTSDSGTIESVHENDSPEVIAPQEDVPAINEDRDAENHAEQGAVDNPVPALSDNNDAVRQPEPGIDLEKMLKDSGAENVILYTLYAALFVLAGVVFFLTRRLIRAYRSPRNKKAAKRFDPNAGGRIGVKPRIRENPVVSEKQMNDVRNFARKLTEMYSKTESEETKAQAAPVPGNGRRKAAHEKEPVIAEHTKKIEAVFADPTGPAPVDSEALRLIREYKTNNVESRNTHDTYEVVEQLSAQGWEVWELARELSMGTEEVKMAIRRTETTDVSGEDLDDNKYSQIYRLADLDHTVFEIASRLHIDEEQVRLALKMRKESALTH